MADIARLAGVHSSTVSRALAGSPLVARKKREQILKLARERGYVINSSASNLRLQRTQTISVAIPLGHEAGQALTDPFFVEMLGHLADEITQRGYGMFLQKILPPMDNWLSRLIASHRADGIIIVGSEHRACDARGRGRELPADGGVGRSSRPAVLLRRGHGQHGRRTGGGGASAAHRPQEDRVSGRPFHPRDQAAPRRLSIRARACAGRHCPRTHRARPPDGRGGVRGDARIHRQGRGVRRGVRCNGRHRVERDTCHHGLGPFGAEGCRRRRASTTSRWPRISIRR